MFKLIRRLIDHTGLQVLLCFVEITYGDFGNLETDMLKSYFVSIVKINEKIIIKMQDNEDTRQTELEL
jgi:hypothetical protein